MIEGAGLAHDPPPDRVPNSNRALRLTELARDRGVHDALHHRLLTGYWSRRLDALASEELGARVEASTRAALSHGVGGVPAWAIDQRLIIPGAQPHEVFDTILQRLGHRPLISGRGEDEQ
jgi:predicted DsbA family dithiol-disulfide isomerase